MSGRNANGRRGGLAISGAKRLKVDSPLWTRAREGPFAFHALRSALRLAVRASAQPRRSKSRRAVTRGVLDRLLSTCASDGLVDARDAGVSTVAFASGGRRRSEVAGLRGRADAGRPPSPFDPAVPNSAARAASPSGSAAPRRLRPTTTARCFWSARRS